MKLNTDLKLNEDFVLVNQIAWQQLLQSFGGAFEIGYFLVDKSYLKDQYEESELEGDAKDLPDLRPVKIDI